MYYIDEQELEAIRRVILSRRLFRYQVGRLGECDQFEAEFARRNGVNFALMLTSGTNALIAALTAAGVGEGDEVIVPAYTFVATAAAVMNVGAVPVVANIDSDLGLCVADVKRRLSPKTKALIPVHMDGLATDLAPLVEIAAGSSLAVIEDVAQAIGGSYHGKPLGAWGRFGCFSLNENKNISCGEGGIVTTNERADYERILCIHDASIQFSPRHKDTFTHIQPFVGSSMRVSEISGAVMRVQFARLDRILGELRARKKIYLEMLTALVGLRIPLGGDSSGDCCSSLHLQFQDPAVATRAGALLRAAGVPVTPVLMRPGHSLWKWLGQLSNRPDVLPSDYLESLAILSQTLKMDIDIHLSEENTRLRATTILRILAGLLS